MSFVFDAGPCTVWTPSLQVGDLYVRFVTQVSELLGVPTGLSEMVPGYYLIGEDEFEVLVNRMFDAHFRSTHQIGRAMLESVLAPSVVILDRIYRPISAASPLELAFLEKARALPMPCDPDWGNTASQVHSITD